MTAMEELFERLKALPRLRITFGGADVGVPDALVYDKVLAVVQEFIDKEGPSAHRGRSSIGKDLSARNGR